MLDAQALRERRGVTAVAIDELQDAGRLPEGREPFLDPGSRHGVDEPVAIVVHERM